MHRKKLLNEKIARIILNILANKSDSNEIRKKLIDFFTNEGLEEKEILDILEEVSKSYKKTTDDNLRFRILSPLEVENLTDEALNYLLILKEENRINEEIFEDTLLDISGIYGTIDLPILKELLKIKGIDKKRVVN